MSQTDISNTDTAFTSVTPPPASTSTTYRAKYFLVDAVTTFAGPSTELKDCFDELKWNKTFKSPHIRRGLRLLAAEALQELASGETEEGGFSVE